MNIEAFVKKIFPFKKIALIGNSDRILLKKYGKFIDSHDFIIRINTAPTKSFEEYVGKRTNLRFISNLTYKEEVIFYPFEKNFIRNIKNSIFFLISEEPEKKINKNRDLYIHRSNKLYIFHNKFSHKLRFLVVSKYNFLKKLYYYRYINPFSTGMTALCFLCLLKRKISLFGFDKEKSDNNYNHYFGRIGKIKTNHNFNAENKILKYFLNNYDISYY
jgi:hypothetical protein